MLLLNASLMDVISNPSVVRICLFGSNSYLEPIIFLEMALIVQLALANSVAPPVVTRQSLAVY
jgi:hypothetical protein